MYLPHLVEQLFIGISTGAIYAIVAIGFNLVFGTMNVLNLAHGATMMLGSYGLLLAYYLGLDNFWLAAVAGIGLAIITGLTIERVAVRPLRGHWWNTKVATLGVGLFLENLVALITAGFPKNVPRPFNPTYHELFAGIEISDVQVMLILISISVMLGMVAFLRRTPAGKAIRVLAQSPDLARSVGINVDRVTLIGFGVSGMLAGVAGILNAMTYGSTYPFVGVTLGLKGIVVLIVAGIGNMRGCLYVGLALGIAETMAIGLGGSHYRDLIAYLSMVLILLVRPHGLFGEEGRVEREV
ncbi:MAG: branched-chain amino acid ABC transporter permease [Alphaproteobacteria bacterium]|nr:branched-chain amino acid ABC transporter permease [Alphaproteobacteria bacterium]